jgi:hypothetical protein
MWFHQGDVEKAQQMVDFYTKNLALPETEPVPPNWVDHAKSIYGWIKENQNELVQGYQFIQTVIQNKGVIPTIGQESAGALPPING